MHNLLSVSKSLADETRLRILNLLGDRDFCVCELQDILQMSEPRISRHVRILKEAGLLSYRKKGKWVYYSLNKTEGKDLLLSYLQLCFLKDPVFKRDKDASANIVVACSVQ